MLCLSLSEVALGLNQLHTSNPPIIHRDLKGTKAAMDGWDESFL